MKKMCLIIPTQNRTDSISYYVKAVAADFALKGIDIIIYDTSQDESTQQIIRTLNFPNVYYRRYEGVIEKNAIDYKVFAACEEYCDKYDYLCFSSDGTLVHLDLMCQWLEKYTEAQCDVIVYDNRDLMGMAECIYTDPEKLFRDCCWRMTCLSSCIVSGAFLKRCMECFPVYDTHMMGLWLPMTYFWQWAQDRKCSAVYHVDAASWSISPLIQASFWKTSGSALWQWGELWCCIIDGLPAIYDREKVSVAQSHDQYTSIFSVKGIFHLKAYGNITWHKVKKYQSYIPRVTKTSVFWFYFVALCGNQKLAQLMIDGYHRMRKRQQGKAIPPSLTF